MTAITRHAIDRYRERVDPSSVSPEAILAIGRILSSARTRSCPRRWCRMVGTRPGSRYLFSAEFPGICLVVRGGTVVTVFSRRVCAEWRTHDTRIGRLLDDIEQRISEDQVMGGPPKGNA